MFRPLQFSILSLTVWMTGILLADCFSPNLSDDDQDGGPPSLRNNNTNLSGLSLNQGGRFPINGNNPLAFSRFQQQSPFGSPFQPNGLAFNPFQQQQQQASSFGFPQNAFQQPNGFSQQQSGLFPQNGFQQPGFASQNGLLGQQQQKNGVLSGQGSQFNSVGLQNQMGAQQLLGLQNQMGANGFQNQLGLQNQLGFQNQLGLVQNPFALSLLQQNQLGLQNNQLGFQNPFAFQNQMGLPNQFGQQQNPFGIQSQLGSFGLNSNDLNGSQFGLGSSPFGPSNMGFSQNGLGLGSFPQSNGGSPFGANAGLGTGSSSLLGANQVLLQGGQFQDPSSTLGSQFANQNRFPFGTSSMNSNRLPASNNGVFGSQFAGSQFNNQFSNDPFLSQRQQLKNNDSQSRPVTRNGVSSSTDRALDFNNTNEDGFPRQQSPQQPAFNPFQTPLLMGPVSRPLLGGNSFPSPLDQQRLQMNQLSQQEMEEAPLPSPFGRQPSMGSFGDRPNQQPGMNNVPNGSFNSAPSQQGFNNPPSNGNLLNDRPANDFQSHHQWFPIPIPETGFSCDGRPPGYYADVKNGCQTFHICIDDGASTRLKRSFACPNGTLFDQTSTICQWKDNVDCSRSQIFYPRPAASTISTTPASPPRQSGDVINPTTATPFNTQIPSPIDSRFQHGNTPSQQHSLLFSSVGQPSPALGSLDAGRSMRDMRRASDAMFQPAQVRPALFRPSEQIN